MAKGVTAAADEGRSFGYSSVTFEVTPREAELLVFAQHMRGQLTLSLRHPEDVTFERALPEVNFQYLEKSLPEINLNRQREIRNKIEL
jgi:Flp pilus assembly protein CpaB